MRRAQGKLRNLEEAIRMNPVDGTFGIGHTRWATHGRPTEENAHPHRDCKGDIVVVHNGIVENYLALKQQLQHEGHVFKTETDTEVIAHLVEKHFEGNLEEAVRAAVKELTGVFALAVISRSDPQQDRGRALGPAGGDRARRRRVLRRLRRAGHPQPHARHVLPGRWRHGGAHARRRAAQRFRRPAGATARSRTSCGTPSMAEKGGYKHFMLKEIFEQPRAVRDTTLGRVGQETGRIFLDEMDIAPAEFARFRQVKIIACGTSWHAALAGKFMIEKLARIPVEVDYGSEFRYRDPIVGRDTLTVVISQSGETADTLAAQREAKAEGLEDAGHLQRGGLHDHARGGGHHLHARRPGDRRGLHQGLHLPVDRAVHPGDVPGAGQRQPGRERVALPGAGTAAHSRQAGDRALARRGCTKRWRGELHRATDFLFLGRGVHFPIALEGALKLKEISYIHAEGYPAGEMKHGPNALIDEKLPVVVLATHDPRQRREPHALREDALQHSGSEGARRHRGGDGHGRRRRGPQGRRSRHRDPAFVGTAVADPGIVPLQLLAYHIAVRRGCDVDQPRNLAKSVTVE